jgi:Rrf2 family transcriptional regulator, nitric oxide-sensitive transcriptional repressor
MAGDRPDVTLTKFSDYSLRVLIYLGLHEDRLVSVSEIGRAYRVSPHHIVKVVQVLVEQELITTVRGRNGGLRLDKPPAEINIGRLIRRTEPGWNLVECFDADSNTCPIDGVCGLKGALGQAQRAFLDVLDQYSLAHFLPRAPALVRLLNRSLLSSKRR